MMRGEPSKNPAELPPGTMFVLYDPMAPRGRYGTYWRKRPFAVCYRRRTGFSTFGLSYHATPEKALAAAAQYGEEHGFAPPPAHIY